MCRSLLLTILFLGIAQASGQEAQVPLQISIDQLHKIWPCGIQIDNLIRACDENLRVVTTVEEFRKLYHLKSEALLLQGDSDAALIAAEKAASLEPPDVETATLLCRCLAHANRHTEAMQRLDETLLRHPQSIPALVCRASITYSKMKDYPATVDQATVILEADPEATQAYLVRAAALANLQQWSEALADVNQFLKMEGVARPPTPESAHFLKATILYHQWHLAEAIAVSRTALALNPNSLQSTELLWKCCVRQNDMGSALIAAQQLVKLNPDSSFSHHAIGQTLFKMRKYDEAIPYLKHQLKAKNSELNLLLLAAACFGAGRIDDAASHYNAATRAYPASWGARLAQVQFLVLSPAPKKENHAKAKAVLAGMLAAPDLQLTEKTARFIAILLCELGDREEALELLEQFQPPSDATTKLATAIQTFTLEKPEFQVELQQTLPTRSTIQQASGPTVDPR